MQCTGCGMIIKGKEKIFYEKNDPYCSKNCWIMSTGQMRYECDPSPVSDSEWDEKWHGKLRTAADIILQKISELSYKPNAKIGAIMLSENIVNRQKKPIFFYGYNNPHRTYNDIVTMFDDKYSKIITNVVSKYVGPDQNNQYHCAELQAFSELLKHLNTKGMQTYNLNEYSIYVSAYNRQYIKLKNPCRICQCWLEEVDINFDMSGNVVTISDKKRKSNNY